MIKLIKIFLILIIVFIAVLFLLKACNRKKPNYRDITVGNKKLNVMIADNAFLREKGLSGRDYLLDNQGMLFVFQKPGKYYFWMKGMKFPIDIIWFDKDKKIVDLKQNIKKDYKKLLKPNQKVKYVLETNKGWLDKNNIKVGDQFKFLNNKD